MRSKQIWLDARDFYLYLNRRVDGTQCFTTIDRKLCLRQKSKINNDRIAIKLEDTHKKDAFMQKPKIQII